MDTQSYREKYKKRQFGSHSHLSYPAGGADVIELCDVVDALVRLIRDIQRKLPVEEQNDVEIQIWNISKGE